MVDTVVDSMVDTVVVTGVAVDIMVMAGAGDIHATVMDMVTVVAIGVVIGVAITLTILIIPIMATLLMEKEMHIIQEDMAEKVATIGRQNQEVIDMVLLPWEDQHPDLVNS